jgi:hypothetical protein
MLISASVKRRLEARAMLTRKNADHRRGVSLKQTTACIALPDTAEPCIKDAYQRLTSALTSSEYARLVTIGSIQFRARRSGRSERR